MVTFMTYVLVLGGHGNIYDVRVGVRGGFDAPNSVRFHRTFQHPAVPHVHAAHAHQ